MSDVIVREATEEDIPFVADCVLAAVDLYDFRESSVEKGVMLEVCGRDDTLYSWRNARIAAVDGVAVGCLVAYDGACYPEGRPRTFRYFYEVGRSMDDTEYETGPGEYYLDSMAILPSFRGYGIGHLLMTDAMGRAEAMGFGRISLLVECSKPGLRDYYAELGFEAERELNAFGDRYLRMVAVLKSKNQ